MAEVTQIVHTLMSGNSECEDDISFLFISLEK